MTDSALLAHDGAPPEPLSRADPRPGMGRARAGTTSCALHGARVYRLAYRLTGNAHDAEDLTQDVFVRVFRSLGVVHPWHVRGVAAPHHHQPVPRHGSAARSDPVRGARRRRLRPARRSGANARAGLRRRPLGRRCAARAGRARTGVSGRRRAVRHRAADVRGDRRRRSASSWARSAAGSTAAALSCAQRSSTALPTAAGGRGSARRGQLAPCAGCRG